MKKIKFLIVLLITCSSFSQRIVGFGGFGTYLNRNFEKGAFYSLNTGFEYNNKTFIKPEIKFEYFLGTVPDISLEFNNDVETKFLTRKVSAANVSISPKISLGDNDDSIRFQILPMYNFTKVFADGSVYTLNSANNAFIKTDSDSYSEIKHSLGIGLAILYHLNEDTFQAISFELNYNNIDLGNALSKLKVSSDKTYTNQSLGIRMKYYF